VNKNSRTTVSALRPSVMGLLLIVSLILLLQFNLATGFKIAVIVILGLYIFLNAWHHHRQQGLSTEIVVEYALIALLTWFILTSLKHS